MTSRPTRARIEQIRQQVGRLLKRGSAADVQDLIRLPIADLKTEERKKIEEHLARKKTPESCTTAELEWVLSDRSGRDERPWSTEDLGRMLLEEHGLDPDPYSTQATEVICDGLACCEGCRSEGEILRLVSDGDHEFDEAELLDLIGPTAWQAILKANHIEESVENHSSSKQ